MQDDVLFNLNPPTQKQQVHVKLNPLHGHVSWCLLILFVNIINLSVVVKLKMN